MRIADTLIAELEQEAAATRRVLERIPADKLTWRPHKKSMSLGQLGLHVAQTPASIAGLAKESITDTPPYQQAEAKSSKEVMEALDDSLAAAKVALDGWDDGKMMETWSMSKDGKEIMSMPRAALLRAIMLNHWYHHRGQLVVYLRMLDVPLPSVYGPTADENPWP